MRTPREDLRRNFCAAANFKYQRGYRSRNSGVRSTQRASALRFQKKLALGWVEVAR